MTTYINYKPTWIPTEELPNNVYKMEDYGHIIRRSAYFDKLFDKLNNRFTGSGKLEAAKRRQKEWLKNYTKQFKRSKT